MFPDARDNGKFLFHRCSAKSLHTEGSLSVGLQRHRERGGISADSRGGEGGETTGGLQAGGAHRAR